RLLLLTVPFVALTILSVPAVGRLALKTLESRFPARKERPADTQAIVVLAGGGNPPEDPDSLAEVGSSPMPRLPHPARLYQRGTACPVLASGGKVNPEVPGPAFAEVMRGFLLQLGVPAADIIVEDTSRTTYENAVESCKLLAQRNITKIVLVTDALHMNRAS